MTIIAEKDRPAVRDLLARELAAAVELLLFTRGRSRSGVAGGQDGQSCEETRELLEELAALSDRLHLTSLDADADPVAATRYNVTAVPTVIVRRRAIATGESESDLDRSPAGARATPAEACPVYPDVGGAGGGANVRFLGLPGGYEFSVLLADVVDVSTGRTDLSAEARAVVRAIDSPVHIQVFVTPT